MVALGFVAAVFACYFFYPGFDAYQTLRFLLPAMPALFVLLGVTLATLSPRLPPAWRALALIAIVV